MDELLYAVCADLGVDDGCADPDDETVCVSDEALDDFLFGGEIADCF